jgi:lipopolysaccharide transport system permease protein
VTVLPENELVTAPTAGAASTHPVEGLSTVIRPSKKAWVRLDLRDLWRYRELLLFLAWRDVKVKYKQTVVGLLWVIVQPLMTMIIFTFVFGRLAGLPSQGVPYPLFVLSGLVVWQYFASSLTGSTTSVVGSSGLISKVYFPRLVVPISTVIAGLVDFIVALGLVAALMAWYNQPVAWRMLLLPAFVLLAMVTALGVGLWLSMLNVQFRDVQFTVPFLTQIWLFCSPVAYAAGLIPPKYQLLFALNPMTIVINGFRWSLLGTDPHFRPLNFVSIIVVVVLFAGGLIYFKRAEKTFADVI